MPWGSRGRPAPEPDKTRAGASGAGKAKDAEAGPIGSDTSDDPLVGKTIGGCKILSPLGKGAMGTVYKAEQVSLGRLVALKTIREDFCTDEGFLKRFLFEAQTVGRFKTPHVVQIHEVGCDRGVHFITMELVSNGNLLTYLKRRESQRLDHTEALKFIRQAAEGLLEAERLKVVHRDIKPENLLLDHNHHVKIADFGIARGLEAAVGMTASPAILGTPLYMSPEQARGENLDHRSDMYALGATFFYLLTRRPPVPGNSVYEIIQRKMKIDCLSPAEILAEELPAPVSRIVENMTALDINGRYPSFENLIEDLDRVGGGRVPGTTESPNQKSTRRRKRIAVLAIATTVTIALLVGGLLSSWTQKSKPKNDDSPASARSDTLPTETTTSFTSSIDKSSLPADFGRELKVLRRQTELLSARVDPELKLHETRVVWEKIQELEKKLEGAVPDDEATRRDRDALTADVRALGRRSSRVLSDAYLRRFEELEVSLMSGPSLALLAEAEKLRDDLTPTLEDDARHREIITALVDDCRTGVSIQRGLGELGTRPPPRYTPPFSEVATRFQEIREALRPGINAGASLNEWMRRRLERHGAEVAELTAKGVEDFMVHVEQTLVRFNERRVSTAEMEALLKTARSSKKYLRQAFPEREREWDALLADARLSKVNVALEDRRRAEATLVQGLERLDVVRGEMEQIGNLATWKQSQHRFEREIQEVLKDTEGAPEASRRVQELVKEIRRVGEKWAKSEKLIHRVLRHLEDRTFRSKEASRDIAALKTRTPDGSLTLQVVKLAESMSNAFDALDTDLHIERAGREFTNARQAISDLEDSISEKTFRETAVSLRDYVTSCQVRWEKLRELTEHMAPVRPGSVPDPSQNNGARLPVPGFFIDPVEVSARDFQKFIDSQVEKTYAEVHELWPGEKVFQSVLESFQHLRSKGSSASRPIDEVHFYHAAAYAAWRGKRLPDAEEWFLAARPTFAMLGKRKLSRRAWRDFNIENDELKPVHEGENNPGFPVSHSVHHLLGNVAEWCRWTPAEDVQPVIAGRRYLDNFPRKTQAGRLFSHFIRRRAWNEARPGVGFRTVVSPREVFGDLLPKE